jgi:hypothetical protein
MRLNEIKVALIEQFFSDHHLGISRDKIEEVFVALGKKLQVDLSELASSDPTVIVEAEQGISSDPSKAFRRFTEGRIALLMINEDDGVDKRVIFAAVRVGRQVIYEVLTAEERVAKIGDLAAVKQALRQSKNINDDVYYTLKIEG